MKNLLALIAILASTNVYGQVNGFQMPYNPDVEPDGFIGISDVLEMLVLFGNEFLPENFYVSNDSSHIVLNQGQMNYFKCSAECASLEGSWRVATELDFGFAWDALPENQYFWLDTREYQYAGYVGTIPTIRKNPTQFNSYSKFEDGDVHCLCATLERPKIEYTYCTDPAFFDDCIQEKTELGWWPLGAPSRGSNAYDMTQAFWRWAE